MNNVEEHKSSPTDIGNPTVWGINYPKIVPQFNKNLSRNICKTSKDGDKIHIEE